MKDIQNHLKFNRVENFAGFAAENIEPRDNKAKVLLSAFIYSDQPEFYLYSDRIAEIYLNRYYPVNKIHRYLIVIHQDVSADIYVNDFPIVTEVLPKRSNIKKDQAIRIIDIADINNLRFGDIKIKGDDCLIFCFKIGWKFGLFFDCTRNLDIDKLPHKLGTCYKYLTFQEEYAVLENEKMFNKMVNDGWVPFIQLLGGDFKRLSKYYKDKNKFISAINEFINKFDKNRIESFVNKWWNKEIFQRKKSILTAGINAYVRNTESDFITCIKTLYSEIEGIIRMSYLNEINENPSFAKLLQYVDQKAKNKFISRNSLGFPDIFFSYLKKTIFKNFDLKSGKIDLSRHSTSHGVAKAEDYSKMKALQAILVLDQMYFYL
ncbi:hypothetical protein KAI68_05880 [bacterium]|nr:hypothetical protein [bacterium]